MSSIQVVTDSDFESEVSSHPEPVLVMFGASWCAPCKRMASVVETLAASGTVRVFKVDIDDAPDTTKFYGVKSVPTFVMMVKGEDVATKPGVMSLEDLKKFSSTT